MGTQLTGPGIYGWGEYGKDISGMERGNPFYPPSAGKFWLNKWSKRPRNGISEGLFTVKIPKNKSSIMNCTLKITIYLQ